MREEYPAPDEQAALLALDALGADEQADAELRYGAFPDRAAAVLAEATESAPPPGLRERALAGALARRPAGRPVPAPAACSPIDAFERTVADFAALLADLSEDDWAAPAHTEHGTVRELVAHLAGMEELCVGWLEPAAPEPVDPRVGHVEATRPVVEALAGRPPSQVAARWHAGARAVAETARRGDPHRPVRFHDLVGDVDALLVTRTFELWAHGMDITLATSRPVFALDDERMTLMSSRLMAVLPLALGYRGIPASDAAVRFVLTGRAGGCYELSLGHGAPGTSVTIVADVVDLCRAAARRLPADRLPVEVDGDAALARTLLAAVDAFARD